MSLRRRSYDLSGSTLTVESDLDVVLDRLDLVFGCFRIERHRLTDRRYRVLKSEQSIALSIDGGSGISFESVGQVEEYVQWHMSQSALSIVRSDAVVLHAAAVARIRDDLHRAIVLIGPSGSGKSTLTHELLRNGFGFLSDEALFVDASGHAVRGFPRALGLMAETQKGQLQGEGAKEYIDPFSLAVPVLRDPIPVECLVLLMGRASQSQLETLAPIQALPALLKQVYATEPVSSILEALVRLVTSHPTFALKSGDPVEAAAMIANLLPALVAA